MLLNYLLCAYKVLLRRKLFTFISLFAISLTLAVLLVILTIIDNFLHPTGPEKHSEQFLTVDFIRLWDKPMAKSKSGYLGYQFYQDNIARLTTPEKKSLYSRTKTVSHYLQNKQVAEKIDGKTEGMKVDSNLRYTDLAYWQILDFEFIKGHPFTKQSNNKNQHQIIISQSTATKFFGQQNPLNQTINIDLQSFTVIGVVKDVSNLELEARADMWVMNSALNLNDYQYQLIGDWNAMLYHSNPAKLKAIANEYQQLLSQDVKLLTETEYIIAISYTNNNLEKLVRYLTDSNSHQSGANQFIIYLILLMLGFMLLPAINLINLNISRVIERTSEIGVRKSFGASSNQLVMQFFIENLMLTTLGAILGFALSLVILNLIESSAFMPYIELTLSLNQLLYASALVLVFSLLSGVYPAWKMSRLHPINALKGNC